MSLHLPQKKGFSICHEPEEAWAFQTCYLGRGATSLVTMSTPLNVYSLTAGGIPIIAENQGRVGKTSLLRRYVTQNFDDQEDRGLPANHSGFVLQKNGGDILML